MESQLALFHTVLSHLLESFAPHVHQILSDFEEHSNNKNDKKSPDVVITRLFKIFPRHLSHYKTIMTTLLKIVDCNPTLILNDLTHKFKELLENGHGIVITALQGLSPTFKNDNLFHKQIILNFALFFISDLICQIIVNYGTKESARNLSRCGYNLCNYTSSIPAIYKKMMTQWSVIFSIVSETAFDEIATRFKRYEDSPKFASVFSLISYLRLDLDVEKSREFLKDIARILRNMLRKRTLKNNVLESTASLMSTAPLSCGDSLQDIFELAWSVKKDSELKSGAYDVIATIFPRLPELQSKSFIFYKQNVFPQTKNDKKVKRSLRLFNKSMNGIQVDPKWLFWEWGVTPRASALCFVKWHGEKVLDEAYSNYFMKYFFPNNNFHICPKQFRDTMVHLASLDFSNYVDIILPQFLKLSHNDSRFLTFLMTIPPINSKDFLANSISEVSSSKLEKLNSAIRTKVLEIYPTIPTDNENHGVCITDVDTNMMTLMLEADQKVASIIESWKIKNLGKLQIEHMKSERCFTSFDLSVQIIHCATIVLNPEDLTSIDLIKYMIRSSFNINATIASEAMENCKMMSSNPDFIGCILDYLKRPPTSEALFICINMITETIRKHAFTFEIEMLQNIELYCIIGMASVHPTTRKSSLELLSLVNELLDQRGFYSYLFPNISLMEDIVKQRMCHRYITEGTKPLIIMPTGEISFNSAIYTHYYDVWVMFLAEISDIIIYSNYTPLLKRLKSQMTYYEKHTVNIGLLAFICDSLFSLDSLFELNQSYTMTPYEPFLNQQDDSRQHVITIFRQIFEKGDNDLCFSLMLLVNVTLYPMILDVLTDVDAEMLPLAASTICSLLRNDSITAAFMYNLLPHILAFLSVLQTHFLLIKVNGPRLIRWSEESESEVIKYKSIIRDYCTIISQCFAHNSKQINEDDWPISSRENIFRYLVNWSNTKSDDLKSVRDNAAEALVAIVHVGTLISDSLLFDHTSIQLFSNIEMNGNPVLSFLLYFHVDLLLEIYIESCFVQPRSSADLFFEAVFMAFDAKRTGFVRSLSGPLILLGQVYWRIGHPRAESFLNTLIDILFSKTPHPTEIKIDKIRVVFSYATEAVLDYAFHILKLKDLHIPPKDIIEPLRTWVQNLRLLPKQTKCMSEIPTEFERFTPYQFLVSLMETTEIISDDAYLSITALWSDLMQSPDHEELIPLFLCEWKNPVSKQSILHHLIAIDAPSITKRLALHCSFAYYFQVNNCLCNNFNDELWVIPLIAEACKKESEELVHHIAHIIHFAFMFYDEGSRDLLEVLSHQFSIDLPDGMKSNDSLIDTVRQFTEKLRQADPYFEEWGIEALKWLLGSQSLKFATLSLTIFNMILCPIDHLVITGVCKAVTFHVVNSYDDTKLITELVSQAFKFYTACFSYDEVYAYKFASSFIDCKLFVDSCLSNAAQLFIMCLSSNQTNTQAWANIIGIIRPLLTKLETDEQSQKIFELLIKTSSSEELMMIVAPIKECSPHLFPSCMPLEILLNKASETTMCKVLVHYAAMIESATTELLNSIFKITSHIVQKIVNENNRTSLAKIYKAALNNLSNCESAIDFVSVIARYEPGVASNSVFEFYDWNRSMEDVYRSLGRLLVDDYPMVNLTDCSNLQSVYNLLNCDVIPKILPFSSHKDMLEGMMRVTGSHRTKRSQSIRRSSHGTKDVLLVRKPSQFTDFAPLAFESVPLHKPTSLIRDSSVFTKNWEAGLIISPQEFLNSDS